MVTLPWEDATRKLLLPEPAVARASEETERRSRAAILVQQTLSEVARGGVGGCAVVARRGTLAKQRTTRVCGPARGG